MQKVIKCISLVVFVSVALQVSAKSVFEAQNGDTINATVAANDLTRIEISGQKIIKDFSSANVSKKITQPLGQVYLIPNTKSTFNLYIVSDRGNTYNLRLTSSKNASGDSIVIKPAITKAPVHINPQFNTNSYVRNLNYLLETMYMNKDDGNLFSSTTLNQAIITYNNLESVLLKKYTNGSINGYVLLVKNTSKDKMTLSEAQFYSDHTLAVAIENPELLSNDFTRIFLIQETSGNSDAPGLNDGATING